MSVKFKPKPGKPHIRIRLVDPFFYLWASNCLNGNLREKAIDYCDRVNPYKYDTPGEAARALHYGSKSWS